MSRSRSEKSALDRIKSERDYTQRQIKELQERIKHTLEMLTTAEENLEHEQAVLKELNHYIEILEGEDTDG